MIAARVLAERTGAEHWRQAWRESADQLWAQWRGDLWQQDLYGSTVEYIGPAHGFAGNVLALAQGDLLDAERRTRARAAGDRDRGGLRRARERGLPVASGAQGVPAPARSRFAPSGATARPGWSRRWPRSPRTTSS